MARRRVFVQLGPMTFAGLRFALADRLTRIAAGELASRSCRACEEGEVGHHLRLSEAFEQPLGHRHAGADENTGGLQNGEDHRQGGRV